jgi:plastocyanin
MRRIGQLGVVLIALLAPISVAAGDIEGRIVGWSRNSLSGQHPAVAWLEGVPIAIVSTTEPVLAQRSGQFVPPFLVVVVGQTVIMPNEDDVAHSAYSISATKKFDLGYYLKGERKTVTFDRPGEVDVLCLIHSFMRAKILVVPNPYYSSVAADGTFRIRNVPEGTFTLTFWRDGMALPLTQEVTVPAGGKSLRVLVPALSTTSQK